MTSGDAGGKHAPKLKVLQGKEQQILEVVKEVMTVLRDAPAPASHEEVQ
jgi:hypothetical protein